MPLCIPQQQFWWRHDFPPTPHHIMQEHEEFWRFGREPWVVWLDTLCHLKPSQASPVLTLDIHRVRRGQQDLKLTEKAEEGVGFVFGYLAVWVYMTHHKARLPKLKTKALFSTHHKNRHATDRLDSWEQSILTFGRLSQYSRKATNSIIRQGHVVC